MPENYTNQIAKIQTNTKLIGFYDKLQKAPSHRYAQIHAKGEKDGNGFKHNSLIGIYMFDYSKGTGENNVITQFNLAPEQIQFLLTRLTCGIQDYEWSVSKIFGEPDANGLSIAQTIQISRHGIKQDGTISKNPWCIAISNGKGIKVRNQMGGSYMKGGSYVQEKYAFINLSDMDMYLLLKRVDSYITAWEHAVTAASLLQDKDGYERYAAGLKRQNSSTQTSYNQADGRMQYGTPQYNQQPAFRTPQYNPQPTSGTPQYNPQPTSGTPRYNPQLSSGYSQHISQPIYRNSSGDTSGYNPLV